MSQASTARTSYSKMSGPEHQPFGQALWTTSIIAAVTLGTLLETVGRFAVNCSGKLLHMTTVAVVGPKRQPLRQASFTRHRRRFPRGVCSKSRTSSRGPERQLLRHQRPPLAASQSRASTAQASSSHKLGARRSPMSRTSSNTHDSQSSFPYSDHHNGRCCIPNVNRSGKLHKDPQQGPLTSSFEAVIVPNVNPLGASSSTHSVMD